ncbi:MAG: hypothetical protein H6R40_147 [Gemmatimonadetes bacterium]|nr:hypothetical protein [Gemmatimonadota bacterium]
MRLADELLERIRAQETRYDEQAYLFVLASIEFLQARLPERRHVSGQELAAAVRDFAREQFGLMAPSVLGHWGIAETRDIGRIVFTLVDVGLLVTQPGDRLEDFDGAFDFLTAFDRWSYVWQGVPIGGAGGERRKEVT